MSAYLLTGQFSEQIGCVYVSEPPSVPSEQVANRGPAACMPEMRQTHWLAGLVLQAYQGILIKTQQQRMILIHLQFHAVNLSPQ